MFLDDSDDTTTIGSRTVEEPKAPGQRDAALLRAPQPNRSGPQDEEEPRHRISSHSAPSRHGPPRQTEKKTQTIDSSVSSSSFPVDGTPPPERKTTPGIPRTFSEREPSDVDSTVNDDEPDEPTAVDTEQGESTGLMTRSKHDSAPCGQWTGSVLLVVGIFVLLAAGFIAIYFVMLENDSDDSDGAFGTDPPREMDVVATRVPTGVPTVFTAPSATPPSSILMEDTENPTFSAPSTVPLSPTNPTPAVTAGPTRAPIENWVLQSARLGGTRLGEAVAISADGSRAVVSDGTGSIQLFDISQGLDSPTTVGDDITINAVATLLSFDINADATLLAACLSSAEILIYAFDEAAGVWSAQHALQLVEETVEIMSVSLSDSGDLLAVGFLRSDLSTPVQLWAYDEASTTWNLVDETTRNGTFNGLYLSLAADGTMLAISRRQYVGQSLQTGYISAISITKTNETISFSNAGFIATGRSISRVSLSANGMRMAVSNVDGLTGGWSLFAFNPQSKRWVASPTATDLTRSTGDVISARLSGDGTYAVVVDNLGNVFLREQTMDQKLVTWVTVGVVEDPTAPEAMRVSMSRDGSTVVVGRPWYAVDTTTDLGLIQVFRDR